MYNIERYRRVWWSWTLPPWLLVTGFGLVFFTGALGHLAAAVLWSVEVCQHCTLASPLLGWSRTRRALRNAEPPGEGRWLLTSATPLWALGWAACSAMTTVLGLLVMASVPYGGGALAFPLFVGMRILMNIWWFLRCRRDAVCFGVLEVAGDGTARPQQPREDRQPLLFVLDAPGGRRSVTVAEADDFTHEIRIRVSASDEEEVWKAIGPVDDLVRVLRRGVASRDHAETKSGPEQRR
jgi:hypothetical protein